MSRARKYTVRAPVTVTVCVEVEANCKDAAVLNANEKLNELSASFPGFGSDITRPPYLEADGGWFEDFDECEFFLGKDAKVERH